MKNLLMLGMAIVCVHAAQSQPLFTYGNSETGKDEFLRAYNKNKPATSNKEQAIKDYLTLYTNFKLKVKAAQELRLDTLTQIKYDIENFREQIADNYLNDDASLQALVSEAVQRAAKDVHVIYFSVPVAENATPADTTRAYKAATQLYTALKKGTDKYAEVVTEISTSASVAKYSDVGFITVFSVPYNLENIIYSTPVTTVSQPFRTKSGWGIFKILEQREDVGKWRIAQVLFSYPPTADYNTKLAIKEKADSVYRLIQKGLPFAEAASLYSEDRMSYTAGGELPEFTTGKYNLAFEKNVFSLKNDNEISKPFETEFGYHIVKRLGRTATPANKQDANHVAEIKQKVEQDTRINAVKEKFIKEITVKTGFKKLPTITEAMLYADADSAAGNTSMAKLSKLPLSKKPIISFKNGTQIKGSDWLEFVKVNTANQEVKPTAKQLWENYTQQKISNYYKQHLEDFNVDFKYQMQEFKEGNMLFEIMERNVWSKAGLDSVGLAKYYEDHKAKYKWNESADVLIFNCTDEVKAQEAMNALKAGKTWMAIAEVSANQIQADSGRYEITQLPLFEVTSSPKEGTISSIVKNADGTTAFVKYIKLYAGGLQRTFAEARGLVINDYQNVLEQQWVEALRKKYVVKVNNVILRDIIK